MIAFNGSVFPKASDRLMFAPLRIKFWFPLIVFPMSKLPKVCPLMVVAAVREIGFTNEMVFCVFKMPDRETGPAPVSLNVPSINVPVPALSVSKPAWAMESGPLLVVRIFPTMLKIFPVRLIPAAPEVVKSPLISVVFAPES